MLFSQSNVVFPVNSTIINYVVNIVAFWDRCLIIEKCMFYVLQNFPFSDTRPMYEALRKADLVPWL